MNITCLVFDMGGVLLHGEIEMVVDAVAHKLQIQFTKNDLIRLGYHRTLVGEPFETILASLKDAYHLKPSVEELVRLWKESYLTVMVQNDELLQFIRHLKHRYQMALISNLNRFHQQINSERGLFEFFDPCIFSCAPEVRAVKPEKAIFEYALRQLPKGITAEECLFIDDKEHNLVPAQELGFQTIHYHNNAQLLKEFDQMGIV